MDDAQLLPIAPPEATKRRARVRFNQVMRVVRRSHLYAGLFMTPWVFLYGVTGLLFNHPDAFPDVAARTFRAADLAGTSLAATPRPEALAARVVESLNAPGEGGPTYRLVRPSEAMFSRELQATAKGDGRQYTVRYDLASGEGSVRETAERATARPAPFASREGLEGDRPPLADLKEELPGVLSRLGVSSRDVTVRSSPELGFLMEGSGGTWRVQYDLASGAISGRPEAAPGDPLSSRRFLLRLHTAHGYPGRFNARWSWAVAVDLMSVSMVGWGITGLLMWWQMKNVRRVGVAVLAASAVAAAMAAVGMHINMTSAPPAGRGEPPGVEKTGGTRGRLGRPPGAEGRRGSGDESRAPGAPRSSPTSPSLPALSNDR